MRAYLEEHHYDVNDVIWAMRTLEWTLGAIFAALMPFGWVIWVLAALYWIISLWIRKRRQNAQILSRFNQVMILVDILVLSLVVSVTGALHSQAFALYSFEIIFLAIYSSVFWSLWGIAAIWISYGLACGNWMNPELWWREFILAFLSMVATLLGLSLRQTIKKFQQNNVHIEHLMALKTLQESVVKLSSLSDSIDTILQTGIRLLNIDAGYVCEWTSSGTQLITQTGFDVRKEWDFLERYESQVLTRGVMSYYSNLAIHANQTQPYELTDEDTWELVLIPLRDQETIIGVMGFAGAQKKTSLSDQKVILEGLSEMVVNQIRFEKAQTNALKRGRLLAILERVGRIVNGNLEMSALLRSLHQTAAEELEIDSFFVALNLPDDPSKILMQYLFDDEKEYAPEIMDIGAGTPTEQVLQKQEPLLLNGSMDSSQPTGSFRIPKSAIIVPLIREGQVIGAMSVQSYRIFYDEDHMEFVLSVASQAAIAIKNAQLYQQTESIALTDYLTHLGNSRRFSVVLQEAVDHASRKGSPLSLLLIDSDSLKQINDHYGHIAGDTHLQIVAHVIRRNIRDQDTACRYAGDEFVVILPGTELSEAAAVGERIRREMDGKFAWKDSMIGTTVSIGAAEFYAPMTTEELFASADHAMYDAKRQGKNRVAVP